MFSTESTTEALALTGNPSFTYSTRRRHSRYKPELAEQAFVEFELVDESHWRLRLLEIGAGGLCFGVDNERPSLSVGWKIDPVTIHMDDMRISGSLRIAHVTPEFAAGTTCGAEFSPSTSTDAGALGLVVARLEKLGHRSG
jgi:hypothetical protein